MATDKEGLLQAIAQAGTRGAEAYQQAQAQLQAQQAEAVRMALAGVAQSATPEARAQVENIVGQGYAPRQAQMTSDAAISKDYFSKLGAASGTFMDQAAALGPALLQQYEQELALKMAGSGGGGGGGGGSTGDIWDALRDDFGTLAQAKEYFGSQTASNERGSLPGWYAGQQAALSYGLSPEQAAGLGFSPDPFNIGASEFVQSNPGLPARKTVQYLRARARPAARRTPLQRRLLRRFSPGYGREGIEGNQQPDINLIRQQWGL